jgi:hypothetical protein
MYEEAYRIVVSQAEHMRSSMLPSSILLPGNYSPIGVLWLPVHDSMSPYATTLGEHSSFAKLDSIARSRPDSFHPFLYTHCEQQFQAEPSAYCQYEEHT